CRSENPRQPETLTTEHTPARRRYLRWNSRTTLRLFAGSGVGQTVGFGVEFAANVGNRELQTTGQLAAGPVQGIQTRAAAGIDASHLLHDHFGIGVNVKGAGFEQNRALQGLKQGQVLGDVVVLPAYPLGDFYFAVANAAYYDPNARRSRISQRTTIDISHSR